MLPRRALVVSAVAIAIACGSSTTKKKPDAKVFEDAPAKMDAAAATGIGKDCSGSGGSGDQTLCPAGDPICTQVVQSVGYFCTLSCGYGPCAPGGTYGSDNCYCNGAGCPSSGSAGDYAPTPSGGDAICQQQAAMTTATPACILVSQGPSTGSAVAWSCGLFCGVAGGSNYGNCPPNMNCVGNICQ